MRLTPYSTISSAEPVNAVTGYPGFNLQDASTTLVLSSVREHPIRLNSVLTADQVASYPLVNPTTEVFVSPHCLSFTNDGTRFISGSKNLLAIFDVSRPGQGPMSWLPTASKSRSKGMGSGMSMKGIVSALAIESDSRILAAGTFSRHVGLYGSSGQGECVGVFCVEGTEADKKIGGLGITQLIWSSCGRYLYLAERKSDGIMMYDIRKTGQLLGWLGGRNAMTNQRLGIDVTRMEEDGSHGIWAGGTDGKIRRWHNPHQKEGGQDACLEWQGHRSKQASWRFQRMPLADQVATRFRHRCSRPSYGKCCIKHFWRETIRRF